MNYFWLAIAALFAAAGQFFLKLLSGKAALDFNADFFRHFFRLFREPFLWSAVIAYLLVSVFYLKALKGADLYFSYPFFMGVSVLVALVFSVLFLREPVMAWRLAGSMCIIAGLFLLSL